MARGCSSRLLGSVASAMGLMALGALLTLLLVSRLGPGAAGVATPLSPHGPAPEATGVPGATAVPEATGVPEATAVPEATPVPATGSGSIHIVEAGDTLSMIALRYGVTLPALVEANDLDQPDLIHVGRQLMIPPGAIATRTRASEKGYVIVEPGDTLGGIAARFQLSEAALAAANGLADPSTIHATQWLEVPLDGIAAAAPGSSPKLILVDLTRQRLRTYEGETPVHDLVISSGMPPYVTRAGVYAIQNKIPEAYSAVFDLRMPYWMGIYWVDDLQNGFHALPIDAAGETLWEGYLGRPASYGCLILGAGDAARLYAWTEVGTQVVIWY